MKEIKSILKLYDKPKPEAQRSALIQVVKVEDSSYRREGARMLVYDSGIFEGGISGGCLEGDALQKSQIAISKNSPSVVTYDTSREDENNIGVGLGCSGVIDVLISPIDRANPHQIDTLRKCASTRRLHILVTLTQVSSEMDGLSLGQTFYYDDVKNTLEGLTNKKVEEFLLQQVAAVKKTRRSSIVQYTQAGQSLHAFIEVFPPTTHLAIFGDNYDVYPLIEFAKILGWKVSLTANLHKMSKHALDLVEEIYPKEDSPRPEIDEQTAIILMAHDFKTDLGNLINYLDSQARYIGLLGPKKRFIKMQDELKEKNIILDQRKNIFAPCGLEIGANFPEDIAMSILSEISAVFAGKEGGMLHHKESPIHDRI